MMEPKEINRQSVFTLCLCLSSIFSGFEFILDKKYMHYKDLCFLFLDKYDAGDIPEAIAILKAFTGVKDVFKDDFTIDILTDLMDFIIDKLELLAYTHAHE